MHVLESHQHDVQVSHFAIAVDLVRSDALFASDSMAGIRWTSGETRKPSRPTAMQRKGTPESTEERKARSA